MQISIGKQIMQGNLQFVILLGEQIAVLVGLHLIWWLSVAAFSPPAFLIPPPSSVYLAFLNHPSFFLFHAGITASEILLGLVAGVVVGVASAILMALWWPVERALTPILVISQALPVFAIAPLLVLWVGFGLASKIIMAALIIYFPIAASFHDGLKRIDPGLSDLAKLYRASRWQKLFLLQVPHAMPSLSNGLKIAATVAPIGAIVGEWVGSSAGLGFIMIQANARTQTDKMVAALLILAILALIIRAAVALLSNRLAPWSHGQKQH